MVAPNIKIKASNEKICDIVWVAAGNNSWIIGRGNFMSFHLWKEKTNYLK